MSTPASRWRRLRTVATTDRVAWILLVAVALTIFFALALAGRLPAVDLPQHALILQRMIDPGAAYQVDWSTPYVTLFVIARVFAWFTDPMTAMWLVTALAIAALPLSSGALAASLGRSPALGCFAALVAFSEVTSWGFASMVLGASACCLALASAVGYAREATTRRGLLLAAAIALAYWTHLLAWIITVPAVWWVVLLRSRTVSARRLWPLALGTAVTGTAFAVWNLGREVSALMGETIRMYLPGPGLGARIVDLPDRAASFGREGALTLPWVALLLVSLAAIGASLWYTVGVRRRARRLSLRAPATWRRRAARAALPAIVVAALGCYLVAPLMWSGVFNIYPRFLLFAGVLLPVVLPGRVRVRALALLAAPAACALALVAGGEVAANAERTQCIDRIAAAVRPGETLLSVRSRNPPPGYAQPIDWHVDAEIAARRSATTTFDFVDIGASPVRYAPGWQRSLMPSATGGQFRAGDAAEYTALLLVDSAAPPPQPNLEVTQCGRFTLLTDTGVAPGSRPAMRYLPHRRRPAP